MASVQYPHYTLLILFLLSLSHTGESFCNENKIRCESSSRHSSFFSYQHSSECIYLSNICDGGTNCGDRSDESFCSAWNRNGGCSRGQARCSSEDICLSMKEFCRRVFPACPGEIDPRICQMMNNGRIQRLENVILPTTPPPTEPTTPPPDRENLFRSETQGKLFQDTFNVTLSHPNCPQLYTRIGEHCLSLLYILKVGWGEAQAFCEAINGQLVSFADDAPTFISLTKHLRDIELTADFWIGGRYVNETEGWQWLTESAMDLGSPYWGVRYNNVCLQRQGLIRGPYWFNKTACYHYQQAPKPLTYDMCAAITFRHYYYISDEDCMTLKSPLCLYNETLNPSSSVEE